MSFEVLTYNTLSFCPLEVQTAVQPQLVNSMNSINTSRPVNKFRKTGKMFEKKFDSLKEEFNTEREKELQTRISSENISNIFT